MFNDVRKILVIKLRHIGDVLLAVPTIRALKESFPSATVSALVNSGTEDMLRHNPLVESVLVYRREMKGGFSASRISGELGLLRDIRRKGFDMTVDLTGGDRASILGVASGARYRLGKDPGRKGFTGKRLLYTHIAKNPVERTHTVMRDLGVVAGFGIKTADVGVDIHASAEDDAEAAGFLREAGVRDGEPYVHAHPTSRWLFKCWTDDGMAEVFGRIQKMGFAVVVTTGPAEAEIKKARSIASKMSVKPADLSGKLKLKHLASVSRRAAMFFGVDSAPMHIAAAAGIPVVAVFGPSGAFDWGPWDNEAANEWAASGQTGSPYAEKSGVQRFGKNAVVQLGWDCVPCGKDGCQGSKKSRCLDELDADAVWAVVSQVARRVVG